MMAVMAVMMAVMAMMMVIVTHVLCRTSAFACLWAHLQGRDVFRCRAFHRWRIDFHEDKVNPTLEDALDAVAPKDGAQLLPLVIKFLCHNYDVPLLKCFRREELAYSSPNSALNVRAKFVATLYCFHIFPPVINGQFQHPFRCVRKGRGLIHFDHLLLFLCEYEDWTLPLAQLAGRT